jgi:Cys-rich repeat protein
MNQEHFDELAKGVATGSLSGRQALRLMGSLFVGVGPATIPGSAQTKKDKCNKDKHCPPGQFCVAGVCVECRSDADCPAGTVCAGGTDPAEPGTCFTCDCGPSGQYDVACCWEAPGYHVCANLQVDAHHCGRCGDACDPGQVCVDKACVPCSSDEQCVVSGAGNFCVDGVCHGCRSDADCPPGAVCGQNNFGQGVCRG